LFLLPGILLLPRFFGLNGIWISLPVADFTAFLVASYMLYRKLRIFSEDSGG
jgi:Na+-driven multidrug efflux pump